MNLTSVKPNQHIYSWGRSHCISHWQVAGDPTSDHVGKRIRSLKHVFLKIGDAQKHAGCPKTCKFHMEIVGTLSCSIEFWVSCVQRNPYWLEKGCLKVLSLTVSWDKTLMFRFTSHTFGWTPNYWGRQLVIPPCETHEKNTSNPHLFRGENRHGDRSKAMRLQTLPCQLGEFTSISHKVVLCSDVGL